MTTDAINVSRRNFVVGAASVITLSSLASPALARGRGNFRSIALTNGRTGEWLNTVYWADGHYITEVLGGINHILRDWRENLATDMDRDVIDILSATQHLLDTQEPFEVVSGYRSWKTNSMLRRRSRAVAKNSYHIRGMAVDITMKSRTVGQISGAGQSLGRGGVGKYTRSEFVHLDSGPVRDWGR